MIDAAGACGELAGRLLADLGAEVIKLEPPGGAAARRLAPFEPGREGDPEASLYWAAVALGKRSAVLDPLDPRNAARLHALLGGADVFLESFTRAERTRAGLEPHALLERHPALVCVSITPFGSDGPLADAPAAELTHRVRGRTGRAAGSTRSPADPGRLSAGLVPRRRPGRRRRGDRALRAPAQRPRPTPRCVGPGGDRLDADDTRPASRRCRAAIRPAPARTAMQAAPAAAARRGAALSRSLRRRLGAAGPGDPGPRRAHAARADERGRARRAGRRGSARRGLEPLHRA